MEPWLNTMFNKYELCSALCMTTWPCMLHAHICQTWTSNFLR